MTTNANLYALFRARFFTEYFRTPDYEVQFGSLTLSAGQMLSLPMVVLGLALLVGAYRSRRSHEPRQPESPA